MSIQFVGTEILVNTATANDQGGPQITTLSNGGFVVTWMDFSWGVGGATGDASGGAIKAQVFAADGSPLGTEILVNSATVNDQQNPRITALSNGGFVVTWEDFSQGIGGATGDTSSIAVKAQVFTATGVPVGSEILVNTATLHEQNHQQITSLSNGGFVVTWGDFSMGQGGATGDASGGAIKAQIFTADGNPLGTEILVNSETLGHQDQPRITPLSNGGFVVTWGGFDGSETAVKAQVFTATGGPVGSEILVNTATAGLQSDSEITSLSSGGFVVTWTDTGDASGVAGKAQVFTADGTPIGSEILVATGSSSNVVTSLSNGGFVVTWVGGSTGNPSSTAVKVQVFTATGAPVGSEILVNTAISPDQIHQRITSLSNGGFVVTWEDFTGLGGATGDASGAAIRAQVFTADGNPLGTEILVNTATANDQGGPQITTLSNGGFVVTWMDFSHGLGGATGDTNGAAVKAQVFAVIENQLPVVNLTAENLVAEMAQLALDVYDPSAAHFEDRNWHGLTAEELDLTNTAEYSLNDGVYTASLLGLSLLAGDASALVLSGNINGTSTLVIAFRGTDTVADLLHDIGHAEDAYFGSFNPLLSAIADYANENGIEQILFSGHSLGGSMVQIALGFPMAGITTDMLRGYTWGSIGSNLSQPTDARQVNFVDIGDPFANENDGHGFIGPRSGTDIFVHSPNDIFTHSPRTDLSAHSMSRYVDHTIDLVHRAVDSDVFGGTPEGNAIQTGDFGSDQITDFQVAPGTESNDFVRLVRTDQFVFAGPGDDNFQFASIGHTGTGAEAFIIDGGLGTDTLHLRGRSGTHALDSSGSQGAWSWIVNGEETALYLRGSDDPFAILYGVERLHFDSNSGGSIFGI
ncbi:hypothetical protein [Bradyrhizobium icense]|uniref:Uncharacterized protein n=1 Tax=Bradyrhizobium icense TaxID=1274631 RepID=A0A1B1U971_9BRAD|nr:hypothetical protein [Bradyrhizobium icense]ANV99328.1 hypothetical protein LMTR13_03200 [Bradyrhizobium icense]